MRKPVGFSAFPEARMATGAIWCRSNVSVRDGSGHNELYLAPHKPSNDYQPFSH